MQHLNAGADWPAIEEGAVLEGGQAWEDISDSVGRKAVRDEPNRALRGKRCGYRREGGRE